LELGSIYPDYKYFYERAVPEKILDFAAIKFAEYSENTYLAFLWPSGKENKVASEALFNKVIYKKNIGLTERGALNLLIELYKHMDWVGNVNDGFLGAHEKLLECFPAFEPFTVILFQCDCLEKVREIKQKVRDINDIGFSSVHITDTKEEALRVSKLIFNKNGLHFLNYSNPYAYSDVLSSLEEFRSRMKVSEINLNDLVIDGSMILGVYGLRDAKDIDFLVPGNMNLSFSEAFESHDSELLYHGLDKNRLIYDPCYYFECFGFKFVSFDQVYAMKKKRAEEKDYNDCRMMSSLIKGDSLGFYIARQKQKFFYKRLLLKSRVRYCLVAAMKKTGSYEMIRYFYRRYFRR